MAKIRVTNKRKFQHVNEVELDLVKLQRGFQGDVSIETQNGWQTWTGEHSSTDFEESYGFVIIKD